MRRQIRKRIQMVFQDTSGSLNPRKKVGDLIGQGLMVRGMARATPGAGPRNCSTW